MASSSVPAGTESTICPVCKDTPQDPRVLPCKHHVCAHCLQQHVSASTKTDNMFQCPECRVECKLSGGEIADMSVMAKDGNVSKPPVDTLASSAALCTNGEHGSATVFCTDCDEFYCEGCSSSHQLFKLFSGHTMRPVNKVYRDGSAQAKSTSRESTCKQYDQEEVDTYCKTCQGCICSTCAREEHIEHWHQGLVEVVMEARRELEDITAKAAMYMVEQDDAMVEMMQTKENATASMNTARDGIKQAAQQARDIINDHEKKVLRDIAYYEAKVFAKLKSVRKERQSKKANASLFRQEAESLCQSDNAIAMMEHKPLLQDKLNAIRTSKHERITWSFDKNQQIEKSLRVILGNVKFISNATVTPGNITLQERMYQIPLSSNKTVTGLVAIGDCLCIKHDDDPHMWLYDMDRGYTKKCEDFELKSTHGMALLQPVDGTVVVAHSNKLYFVKISTSLDVTLLRVKDIPVKEAVSISACRETGELFICQKNSSEFVIFDEDSKERRRVSVPCKYRDYYPYHVTRTGDGFVIFAQGKLDGYVNFLNENGDERHDNSLWVKTQNMITDNEGRLILPDTDNHKVHLVNTNGRFSQFLLTKNDGIEYPEYVYLDEDSARLYVVHRPSGSGEVRVYKWPSKSGDVLTTNYKLDAQLNKFQYEV